MIARLPFDPSILLPYFPPGANDPNYDLWLWIISP